MQPTAPTQSDLIAAGISQPYASLIQNGTRDFPIALAVHFARTTGWRHEMLHDLTEEQIEGLAKVHPWPRQKKTQDEAA